jgi:hypothetical protein
LNFLIPIAGLLFFAALIYRPGIIAIFFFTITLADINFEVPGAHLNIRAITGILLLLRSMVPDKSNPYPSVFLTSGKYLFIFLFYTVLVTMNYGLADMNFIKTVSLTAISAYLAYHYFFKTRDYTYLKWSLIIAGVICFSDLVYTYVTVGKFPVQRIYLSLLHIPVPVDDKGDFLEVINYGFYGMVCGLTFVFLLNEFINKRVVDKLGILLMPLMFLGVLMSTSRSSLLGIIGISVFLIAKQLRSREHSKKAAKLVTFGVSVVFLSLFLFASAKEIFNLNSQFVDDITLRLIDEPVAVFNKHLGLNYNAQSLDALEWRGEAAANASDAFLNLKPEEQLFGIGFWGFVTRNLGHNDLPPHNGILMLLIESGILGLIIYGTLVISAIWSAFKTPNNLSPLLTCFIFILIYCLGQNGELTTGSTVIFLISLIAENKYNQMYNPSLKLIGPDE